MKDYNLAIQPESDYMVCKVNMTREQSIFKKSKSIFEFSTYDGTPSCQTLQASSHIPQEESTWSQPTAPIRPNGLRIPSMSMSIRCMAWCLRESSSALPPLPNSMSLLASWSSAICASSSRPSSSSSSLSSEANLHQPQSVFEARSFMPDQFAFSPRKCIQTNSCMNCKQTRLTKLAIA